MASFARKVIWGNSIVKRWHSRGVTFDECRQRLMEEADKEEFDLTEDEAITIIRETEEYAREVIEKRKQFLAREDPEGVSQFPDLESEMPHWERYIKNLREQGWNETIIDSLRVHCTAIVDAVIQANRKNGQERTKGLVIGRVQSGKTANMAGVMALCADRGFDAVFVLSGIHNKLNEQTTRRFERDLWTYDLWAKKKQLDREGLEHLQRYGKSWTLLTRESDLLDKNTPTLNTIARPVIGVFKKNINVLNRLHAWLGKHHSNRTSNLKVLFIDDECDQASPNIANISDQETSSINGKVWEILGLLPQTSYIGYTATPFANILNEGPGEGSLYPKDFIYRLPKDKNYFGIREFFGTEEDPEEDGLDIIRRVPSLDEDTVYDYPSLRRAIGYFICSSAARRHCRDYSGHMSMLVHVSHRITDQDEVAGAVHKILEEFGRNPNSTTEFLEDIWDDERDRVSREELVRYNRGDLESYHETESFTEIREYIEDALEEIIVRIDNSEKDEEVRLSYGEEPVTVIAIGGNTLSRGLTLEGLNVSYFTRPGRQYDSLLQMGRWFGYRNGYEDLVRVWTTENNAEFFRFLCLIEDDLRRQIRELYENAGAKPEDVALTVASHPSMRIVRRDAMQEAQTVNTTYFNSAPQTIYFKRKDERWLQENWNAGNRLLGSFSRNDKLGINDQSRCVFETDAGKVMGFFNNAESHQRHSDSLDSTLISKFIEKAVGEGYLGKWHVAVSSRLENGDGLCLEDYRLLRRSRLKETLEPDDSVAAIKTLRDKGDLFYDLSEDMLSPELKELTDSNRPSARMKIFNELGIPEEDIPGLLLLYPIDKTSEPRDEDSDKRTALNAANNVLGWSIVFPSVRVNKELVDRVGIPLDKGQ